jgi:hypothetical protein
VSVSESVMESEWPHREPDSVRVSSSSNSICTRRRHPRPSSRHPSSSPVVGAGDGVRVGVATSRTRFYSGFHHHRELDSHPSPVTRRLSSVPSTSRVEWPHREPDLFGFSSIIENSLAPVPVVRRPCPSSVTRVCHRHPSRRPPPWFLESPG